MAATISGSLALAPSGIFAGADGRAQSANAGNVNAQATSAKHSFFPRIISSILLVKTFGRTSALQVVRFRLQTTAPAHNS
jgi:hypothetical protein